MRILATNDDGIMAPGLAAMRKALALMGEVTVVAPTTSQSAVSHSISLNQPVLCHRIDLGDHTEGYGVEGSPADCVKLAILELMPERPYLVVSGVNLGANLGVNVLYSGTVAAAVEGAFYGVPAVAVSTGSGEAVDFEGAARIALSVIEQFIQCGAWHGALLNVNVPDLAAGPPAGVRVVRQSMKGWDETWEGRLDPRGRTYYWITGKPEAEDDGADTDVSAFAQGYVTVTPLRFDLTAHDRIEAMRGWDLRL